MIVVRIHAFHHGSQLIIVLALLTIFRQGFENSEGQVFQSRIR